MLKSPSNIPTLSDVVQTLLDALARALKGVFCAYAISTKSHAQTRTPLNDIAYETTGIKEYHDTGLRLSLQFKVY